MASPPAGTPVGLEIPAQDVARAAAFYENVFHWTTASSHLGIPADRFLSFTVPGGIFPVGGGIRRVEAADLAAGRAVTKLYLLVDDIAAAKQAIENHGGKTVSGVVPEGSKGFFQFFQDSEGNGQAIYQYAK